jgi:uncharacterized repeat protein (TIGR02543 family)
VVTLGADQTVTATFVFERFVLSVSRVGPGSVSSRPVGISCGATCIGAFAPGTTVTVTATAAAGATFSGWTGACAGTLGRCTVTMNAARSVTAAFTSTASGVFSDDPLAALVGPIIKAVHVTDLRLAIDRERTRRLLSPFGWTDPVLVPGVTAVRAAHLLQMRTALAEAYQAAGRTPPTYSDAAVIARQTAIRAAHIEELRDAVLALR